MHSSQFTPCFGNNHRFIASSGSFRFASICLEARGLGLPRAGVSHAAGAVGINASPAVRSPPPPSCRRSESLVYNGRSASAATSLRRSPLPPTFRARRRANLQVKRPRASSLGRRSPAISVYLLFAFFWANTRRLIKGAFSRS